MTAVFAVVLLAACGGEADTIEGDLAAASEIIEVPASEMEPVGRDRYGFTSANAEATIDVFEVDAESASRFEVFSAPRNDVIEFVRNPVSRGALANVLDPADSVVVILIPLLDPTRDFGVDFDAFFIALDESGAVVTSDYSEVTGERLDELFEFGRGSGREPAEILAVVAKAINSDAPTAFESDALAILRGDG